MPVSIDTHLQSAKERPWDVADSPVEPWYLAWSNLERLCFFLMGVGLPVLNVVSLAVLGAIPVPWHARRLGIVENYPLTAGAVVLSALGWSSLCLAVCCLAPRRSSSRWIQSGLGVGLLFWLPVVWVMMGSLYLWILVPSLAIGHFLGRHRVDDHPVFYRRFSLFNLEDHGAYHHRCSVDRRLHAAAQNVFFYFGLPQAAWLLALFLTPQLACFTFARAVSDVYHKLRP
jgi:hypothetical protein